MDSWVLWRAPPAPGGFRAPLVADTEVWVKGVVTDRDDEARTVELDLTMTNEADETPVLGTAIVGFE